jgi:hypothetical protein
MPCTGKKRRGKISITSLNSHFAHQKFHTRYWKEKNGARDSALVFER